MNEKRDRIELSWPTKDNSPGNDIDLEFIKFKDIARYPRETDVTGELANVLYWSDNVFAMRDLLDTGYKAKIDMIYIDPPFFSGLNFSIRAPGRKFPRAYKDTWAQGLQGYLDYMYPRLCLMHELLREGGTMYVHLDWHVSHYIKILLDEIFGYENFRNQIIWKRLTYKQTQVTAYGVLHDVILYYTKGDDYTWNDVRARYDETRLKKYFCWVETPDGTNIKLTRTQLEDKASIPEGRRFALNPIINPNPNRPHLTYEFLGFTKVWKYTKEKMQDYYEKGIVFQPSSEAAPQKKQYLDESNGMKLNDIFLDIGGVMGGSNERVDFDTQKPVRLLERLIQVSSNPGDTVADFFCGSGTTLVAAARTGRRWIGCDLSSPGLLATRKRLLSMQVLPETRKNQEPALEYSHGFIVRSLNDSENESWTKDFSRYSIIVLKLYGASIPDGMDRVYGEKDGRVVLIRPAGYPTDSGDVAKIVEDFGVPTETGIDVLASQWALDFGKNPSIIAGQLGRDVRLVQIPPINDIKAGMVGTGTLLEELLSNRQAPRKLGTFPFFVLPDITVNADVIDNIIELRINGYKPSTTPSIDSSEVIAAPGIELIDFAAIDWNHDGMTFTPSWYDVKTKTHPCIEPVIRHEYKASGNYMTLLEIADVFGHATQLRSFFNV
ncbi:MAG TPA: site-specific DNA-methyltransferase [Candidatus Lokiarchaeia archaeon]|nr:site-specific DNA-methyltransferase [Candidatus Lokiarchaeia archaeon]